MKTLISSLLGMMLLMFTLTTQAAERVINAENYKIVLPNGMHEIKPQTIQAFTQAPNTQAPLPQFFSKKFKAGQIDSMILVLPTPKHMNAHRRRHLTQLAIAGQIDMLQALLREWVVHKGAFKSTSSLLYLTINHQKFYTYNVTSNKYIAKAFATRDRQNLYVLNYVIKDLHGEDQQQAVSEMTKMIQSFKLKSVS